MQNLRENFKKFLQFYKKNLMIFTLAISVGLLFLSTLYHPFMFVMLSFLMASMIFFTVQEIWCTIFFFLPFDGFLILFIVLTIYSFFLLVFKFFIELKNKKFKLSKVPLILTTIIAVIFSCIYYGGDKSSVLFGILIIGILYFIYLVFSSRENIDARQCFYFALYGLLSSAVLGLILYYIPSAKMFYFGDFGYGMVSLKSRIYSFDGTFYRLLLLCFHENHLYPICAFILAFIVYELLRPGQKSLKQIIVCAIGIIACVTIGMLTLSKAFLILFILIVIYAIIFSIVIYKSKSLKVLIPFLIICSILIAVFFEEFKFTLERFLHYKHGSLGQTYNLIDKITTGRAEIWGKFVDVTFSTPLKALFGVGLFTSDVVAIGPHSFYVALIYRFGIVGIIMLGVLVFSYIKSSGKKLKISWLPFIIVFVFLLMAVQEACLDERLYFLFLGLMLTFSEKNVESENDIVFDFSINKKMGGLTSLKNESEKQSVGHDDLSENEKMNETGLSKNEKEKKEKTKPSASEMKREDLSETNPIANEKKKVSNEIKKRSESKIQNKNHKENKQKIKNKKED